MGYPTPNTPPTATRDSFAPAPPAVSPDTAPLNTHSAHANPATGTARYYAHDHLGSTRGLYSAAGAFLGSYDYAPYGDTYRTWGASISTLGGAFTGKPWDNTTKLYYFL